MPLDVMRRLARRLGRRILYGVPAVASAVLLVGAVLADSRGLLLLAFGSLLGLIAATVRDVRANRIMVHHLRRQLEHHAAQRHGDEASKVHRELTLAIRALDQRLDGLERRERDAHALLALAGLSRTAPGGVPLLTRASPQFVDSAVLGLLRSHHALDAYAVATGAGRLNRLRRGTLRLLRNELHKRGYLPRALDVARAIRGDEGDDRDLVARRKIQGEIAVLSGQAALTIRPEAPGYQPTPGRVLHLVGRSLPQDQVGYTLRTHYLAMAQRDAGLDPHVVTQMGFAHDGEDYVREHLDGVTYHRIPGPRRGQVQLDVWLRRHAQRVANLVRVLRPAVLHAASDFLNAQTALVVGREFGIPVVYESRGFWEESWLSRTAEQFRWDLAELEATYGLPDVYVWRRAIEDRVRREADHVVTLDPVMADRIEAGGVPRERITVVPNGVAVDDFPVLSRDRRLAAELGLTEDTTVLGYISSLVEYEGIDILISAYAQLKQEVDRPIALVIVGDGPVRERLTRHAQACGADDAIFTGTVPHDSIRAYYSVIDIFVVPRRPVEVCHLVTPLKPFEAFSTGRTVVLSNVRALTSIAEQSGAAELFEAGSAESLAETIRSLLTDPERCRQLARAGSAWVRRKRTWRVIAMESVRVYERLGIVAPGAFRIPLLRASDIDIPELSAALEDRERLPYERLTRDDHSLDAETVINQGWRIGPHPRVSLEEPVRWGELCTENRSWNFHLHAWDFMAPVLNAYAAKGEARHLEWCVTRAVSWAREFNEADGADTMAWYDMSLGLRGHRLAYLVEQAILNNVDEELIRILLECVVRHQKEYFSSKMFKPHSNHGVYVALGEIALARRLAPLPGMDALYDQGRERIATVAARQFAADGGHLEHSPDYHRMVLDTFRGAMEAGLIGDPDLRSRLETAEEVLDWFVQPNGELVQVGDTPATVMRRKPAGKGGSGKADARTLRVLPQTGYAIVRSDASGDRSTESSSYLFLMAAFHSQTHKHADDLAITWYDRHHEILVDAGRYGYVDPLPKDSAQRLKGYFYSAPERQYVESTRAHNTVEADGADHVRRGRTPYGSALVQAEERDGHYRLVAAVDHGRWRHQREIIFRPANWLYVVDSVQSLDGQPHDFRVWWNFAAELDLTRASDGEVELQLPGGQTLSMSALCGATLIAPVVGGREPMRGWRSKRDLSLIPAISTGFEISAATSHQFRTLFAFAGVPGGEPPEHPFA